MSQTPAEAEPTQRWHLFVTPRADRGLKILCEHFCHSDKCYLLLHAIGSGQLTISNKPNLELAKIVSQEAIDKQWELAIAAFNGDRAALLAQQFLPSDLEQHRMTVVIEHNVRHLLADLAARLQMVTHAGSQTTSVSALLRAIGHGDLTLVDLVDPEIRLKYLRNTNIVKEYLACRRAAKEQGFLQARSID